MKDFTMDLQKMSSNGLRALLESIDKVLKKDDALPAGQKKIYEARECSDWKEMSDQMESILDDRNETYEKIVW